MTESLAKPSESSSPSGKVGKGACAQLKILLDGRKWHDGGIGSYIESLVTGLLTYGGSGVSLGLIVGDAPLAPRLETLCTQYPKRLRLYVDPAQGYSLDEYFRLSKRVPWAEYDVFHAPHYTLPFGLSIPSVVTIHDIIHLTHGQSWLHPLVGRALISSAIKRAQEVITVSAASAVALQRARLLGSGDRTISVIPNALPQTVYSETAAPAVEKALPQSPYFLSIVSTPKPHKGAADLLKAYEKYRTARGADAWPLVLVGYGAQEAVNLLRVTDVPRGVEVLGAVEEAELHALISDAAALVVPSREEGFCIPIIEAHAQGVPAVLRPVPALLELYSEDFDHLAKDMSVEALAEGLTACQESAASVTPQVRNGVVLHTRETYTPAMLAQATLQVYCKAAGVKESPAHFLATASEPVTTGEAA